MEKYRIIRSGRKTLSIEIDRKGDLIVRAPYTVSDRRIAEFVDEKSSWIEKHLKNREATAPENKFSSDEIRSLAERALIIIPDKASYYAGILNVSYGNITIRNQKTRWGSCSSVGNLNFNCLLMLAPDDVIDYVVVHELCHLKEMNHSKRFWEIVGSVIPDYKEQRKWLKENGSALIRRL